MNLFTPAPPSFLRVAMQLVLGLKRPARAFSSTAYVTSREDDPYKLLGLQQPTSVHVQLAAADIKTAFRKQALLLHPDVAKGTVSDPDAFVRLVAAYELLLDPKARAQYHEKRWKQQQQEPTVASTQGPQQAAHHPDGHVHRQQRSGAQHSQPVTKHQHVSHAELQTWRYGVGHWLSATRARRAALAGGGGGQDDEDEGGIAATARVLLWKHRAELETDVGAALAHAFLGPRLSLSAAQPLPVAFEMEQRQGPHAGPEVLHLVSGRTLLGVVSTQPPLPVAAQPSSHGQEQAAAQQQPAASKGLPKRVSPTALQREREQGGRAARGWTAVPENDSNLQPGDSIGAAPPASLTHSEPHRQHGSLTTGEGSVHPQLPASLSGWDLVGEEGRQLLGRYSRLRSAFGTGTFLTPDERKLLAKLQTEAAHREWQAGLHSVPAPASEQQGCSSASPFAEGLAAPAGGLGHKQGGTQPGSISASASLGGHRLRHRLAEVRVPLDGTQPQSIPQHHFTTPDQDSQCSSPSPSPAQGGSVKPPGQQDITHSLNSQGSGHSSSSPCTRGTSSIDDSSSSNHGVPLGGSEQSHVDSTVQQQPLREKQPSQDTNEVSGSAAGGRGSASASLPLATMGSSSVGSGVLCDPEQQQAALSGNDAREDTRIPATWRFNTDSPGSVTLYLTLTVHSGQPANTKSSSGASSVPSLWSGTTQSPVQPGQALHAWAVAEPRPAGQEKQPRVKVYVQGKLLAGIVGDLVYDPLGHLRGHTVRGGSLGLHMIHAFVISHHGDARPMMRLGARIYRAQLPGSRWWLFPPRTPSHDIGGWYIEWEGYKRATHPGFMDPAVWIFTCAFSTLEFERQLCRHTLPATRQASLLSGSAVRDRLQALLPAHRADILNAGSTLGSSRDSSSGSGTPQSSQVMHSASDASEGASGLGPVHHPSITAASAQKAAAALFAATSAQGAGGQKPEVVMGNEAELQRPVSGGQGAGSLQLLGSSALLECQSWVQGVCWPRLRHLMGFW